MKHYEHTLTATKRQLSAIGEGHWAKWVQDCIELWRATQVSFHHLSGYAGMGSFTSPVCSDCCAAITRALSSRSDTLIPSWWRRRSREKIAAIDVNSTGETPVGLVTEWIISTLSGQLPWIGSPSNVRSAYRSETHFVGSELQEHSTDTDHSAARTWHPHTRHDAGCQPFFIANRRLPQNGDPAKNNWLAILLMIFAAILMRDAR